VARGSPGWSRRRCWGRRAATDPRAAGPGLARLRGGRTCWCHAHALHRGSVRRGPRRPGRQSRFPPQPLALTARGRLAVRAALTRLGRQPGDAVWKPTPITWEKALRKSSKAPVIDERSCTQPAREQRRRRRHALSTAPPSPPPPPPPSQELVPPPTVARQQQSGVLAMGPHRIARTAVELQHTTVRWCGGGAALCSPLCPRLENAQGVESARPESGWP